MYFQVSAIYDINVAFKTPSNPDFSKAFRGERSHAEAFIRRIPISDVPYDDEEKSSQFIHKLFQEKVCLFPFVDILFQNTCLLL